MLKAHIQLAPDLIQVFYVPDHKFDLAWTHFSAVLLATKESLVVSWYVLLCALHSSLD
jgi:hypothetical protein